MNLVVSPGYYRSKPAIENMTERNCFVGTCKEEKYPPYEKEDHMLR
jgi:hypothetical protein